MGAKKNHTLILIVFILALCGGSCAAGYVFSSSRNQEGSVKIEGWNTYIDDQNGILFQYPPDWSVQKEGESIIRISPPKSDSISSDMEEGSAIYGVRVMPLNPPYSDFPVHLTEQDALNDFARINTFFFQKASIALPNGGTIAFAYNIEQDNRSIMALKTFGDRTLEIELGHYFPGSRSLSDMVGYFGIVSTLEEVIALKSKAPVQN